MLANLATALLEHRRIRTTAVRAQALVPFVERLITLAKAGNLAARRQAAAFVRSPLVLQKLYSEIAPELAGRNGGYTKILKLGTRLGDGASLALVELLVTRPKPKVAEKKKSARKSEKETEAKATPESQKEKGKKSKEKYKAPSRA
jgi:large subunit ribosomal protein L17